MIILWGFKGFQRVMGGFPGTCRFCGQTGALQVVQTGTKFTLFFIPLFSFSEKYVVHCPNCGNGDPIDGTRADQLIAGGHR